MQTTKLKPVFKLAAFNREVLRTFAAASNDNSTKLDTNLKSWKEIPGPSSLPLIGQLHHFLPGGELSKFAEQGELKKLFNKYGPLVRFEGMFGVGTMIFVCDPELSAHVLRSENWMPLRPGFVSLEHYRKVYRKGKGQTRVTGLMTDHGEAWKEIRSTVNPVMLQPKTIKLYCNVLDEVAMDMINRMKAERDEKNMLRKSYGSEMDLWALESICTVALGLRLNCLDSSLPDDSPEKQLIRCIQELFVTSVQLDFSPNLWKYFSTPLFKKTMKLYELHESLTKHFLKKGIEQLKRNDRKSEHEKGVLEKLLDIDEDIAYIMASDMLFAGVDTTANTLTGILYLLATHQEKQDKLREEILSKTERRPYLKACYKEGLRIMPTVTGNLRKTSKEYDLLGFKIPKDINLIFAHRDMSLMDENYPQADQYIPERWIADKHDPLYYGNAHPFAHAPFGFGVRSCIGRRIAELEIETFLSRIIENFQVEWHGPPPTIHQASINYVKGPFYFVFNDVK